ncbi:uncharacterized protein LOC135696562 isoform X2 [Rhopilema esculentum]|uniref:uncharacterized protein LOC135696562 isoform X2 n=1 Tax=Rhopilema esculentum TaxID=499914 RepID=UPI0031E15EEE
MDLNLYLDTDLDDSSDEIDLEGPPGEAIKQGPIKKCTNCETIAAVAKKICTNCKQPFLKAKSGPETTLKSTNVTRMKKYIKKYADTMARNSAYDVVILYGSHHTRRLKTGKEATVFDIATYATSGFGTHFIGEGGWKSRPDAGLKVMKLFKTSMEAYYGSADVNDRNEDTMAVLNMNDTDVADGAGGAGGAGGEERGTAVDVIYTDVADGAGGAGGEERGTAVDVIYTDVADGAGGAGGEERGTAVDVIHTDVAGGAGGEERGTAVDVIYTDVADGAGGAGGEERGTAVDVIHTDVADGAGGAGGEERGTAVDVIRTKRKIGKFLPRVTLSKAKKRKVLTGKIESEWKEFRGRKARIFWPPITEGISDSWGNKFWHCEFGEETKNEVDVCYNGMFTAIDGTEGFSSDGKCTIRSAKANLLKDWEILLVE